MDKLKIYLFIGASLLTAACSPKYYSPTSQNVPLFTKKGPLQLSVYGNDNRLESQNAYALTDNIAMQFNGAILKHKDQANGNGGSGGLLELGVGYFKPIGRKFVFETYGLLGFGYFENHLPSTISNYPGSNGNISAGISRYGIQPNFGFKSKYFTAALSTRISGLNYSDITGNLIYGNVNQQSYLNDNKANFLLEPALTISLGLDWLKLQIQSGNSFNLSNKQFPQDKKYLNVGLRFDLK